MVEGVWTRWRSGTGLSRRPYEMDGLSWGWLAETEKFVHTFAEIARPLTGILKSMEVEEKFGRSFSEKAPAKLDQKALTAFENLNRP